MEKTIYLHIGAHKTGTTAIQLFLSSNREKLKANGVFYPGKEMAHHDMAKDIRTLPLLQLVNDQKNATSRYLEEINKSNVDKIVLSSEEFERSGHSVDNLKKILLNKYRVKIIYYIRCQDDKIESVYNASVKNPDVRSTATFSEFFSDRSEIPKNNHFGLIPCCEKFGELDYYSVLSPWSRAFGKENIIVRCYEKEQLPEGIYYDFLESIGLRPDGSYDIPPRKVNRRLSWDLIEIIRLCNIRFRNNPPVHQFLINSLAKINHHQPEEKQRLLSPQQREDIMTQFKESNANVAREYLGRTDGRLFSAPLPVPDESWTPYTGLTVEKFVPILTRMIVNQDREHRNRWNALTNRSLKQRILMKTRKWRVHLK